MNREKGIVINRRICFEIALLTIAASIPWLGAFSVRGVFYIFLNLATAVSAFCCFRELFEDEAITVLCSAMYMLSCFRIYTLALADGVTEGIVLALFPWVLYGWNRVGKATQRKRASVLAGIVTMVMAGLWYLSAFVDFRLQTDSEWHQMYMHSIQDKGLYPAHLLFQFWRAEKGIVPTMEDMQDTVPVGLGIVLVAALCVFVFLWFCNHLDKQQGLTGLTQIACVGAFITMGMSLNSFPWEKLQALSLLLYKGFGAIRFPYRFLGWSVLFAVEVYGYCLWFLKNRKRWIYEVAVAVGIVGLLTGGIYLMEFIAK